MAVYRDDFSGTNGDAIDGRTAQYGGGSDGWTWTTETGSDNEIQSNQFNAPNPNAAIRHTASFAFAGDDQYAEFVWVADGTRNFEAQACLRYDSTADDSIRMLVTDNQVQIRRVDGGSSTTETSKVISSPVGLVCRMEIEGLTAKVYVDGVEELSHTFSDSADAFSGNTECGLATWDGGNGKIDDFEAGDIAATTATAGRLVNGGTVNAGLVNGGLVR